MQRWVIHIDMDAFYASCEQLTRPTLRGRPVLVGGVSGRGVVAGASYEARALGARSAMPMYQAKALIGYKGVVVTPRRAVYEALSQQVFSILGEVGGIVEQVSIDEGFLEPEELAGANPETVEQWAQNIRAAIRERTGLNASVGAGAGKQFAKIGSGLAKPDGVKVISSERHEELLHPLPVSQLWGVGPVTRTKLNQLGVETIGDLARMSQREVDISLGATVGRALWEMAKGNDPRKVAPRAVAKQISAEHTYPQDLSSKAQVDAAMLKAAQGAHRRLLFDGRAARTVTLKLRMSDFHIESRSHTLAYPTDDFATLYRAVESLARYPDELGPIRLVGVGFSGLESAKQDVLFPELESIQVPSQEDDVEVGVHTPRDLPLPALPEVTSHSRFRPTQDVSHPDYGHGWVQGIGHGVVSVRFETRVSTTSIMRTFAEDDEALQAADPLNSLAWEQETP